MPDHRVQQPRPCAGAHVPRDARVRLLAAAEQLLLDQGLAALSTRSICRLAEMNVSQIRYYFGNLNGLFDAVLDAELAIVSRAFVAVDLGRQELGDLVSLLITAVRAPAAFAPGGFAALVIEHIYREVSPASRRVIAGRLAREQRAYINALTILLPHLSIDAIRYRFTGAVAMIMAMLPQASGSQLFSLRPRDTPAGRKWRDQQLGAMCLGLLRE